MTVSSLFTGGIDFNNNLAPCDPTQLPFCAFLTSSQVRAGTCQPGALTDSCTGQTIAAGGSCKVDVVYCPFYGTLPSTLYLEIVTDEHKQDGTPTDDATRVVVQFDGRPQ